MPLKIVKETDPIEVKQVCVLLYGQPGRGKTSMGQTANAPLTLDFDKGIHRSGFRKDAVPVEQWEEVSNISASELEGYSTVVVDTVGRCLDMISAYLMENNPKYAQASGALTLQGYGALKATFMQWVKRLRECGVDVILLAHDAEDKQGDDIITRPDVQGGSKQEVLKVADAIGYLHQTKQGAVLDFNASDEWIGKNCAGFAPLRVPDFKVKPDFFAGIIQQMKEHLNSQSDEQRQAAEEVAQWKADIESIDQPADLTAIMGNAKHHEQWSSIRQLIWNHAKNMGWEFNRQDGKFFKPDPGYEDMEPGEEYADELQSDDS